MPGPVQVLRVTLRSSYRRVSSSKISTCYPAHSRAFHVSKPALKKKGKAVQNDTLFDDDSDADDLFSVSTPDPKSQTATAAPSKPEPLPRRRLSPSSETGLVDEKAAELLRQKEEERRDTFQSHYEYLYERTGDIGKQSSALPAKRALRTLVRLAISQEEWQRVIGTFRQWRRYPARAVPSSIQQLFIERTISTGHAPLVVDILTHHPIYGIHISSLPLARTLLKNLITPVNAPPVSEVDPTTHRERLGQALRLAEVFSISTIPVGSHSPTGPSDSPESVEATQTATHGQSEFPTTSKPITLSPANDLILGSLLLGALLRVASLPHPKIIPTADSAEAPASTVVADPTALAQAAYQLFISLRRSPTYSQSTIGSPQSASQKGFLSGKEALWGIAALSECLALLSAKGVRTLFEGINEIDVDGVDGEGELAEKVQGISVDEMIAWLGKARVWLVEGTSERGAVIRSRVEAVLVKGAAEGLAEVKGGITGGNGVISGHLLGQGNAQAEVRA